MPPRNVLAILSYSAVVVGLLKGELMTRLLILTPKSNLAPATL
jgi:hypothetical protein